MEFLGTKDHGGVHDGTTVVLWEWAKGDIQSWKILPWGDDAYAGGSAAAANGPYSHGEPTVRIYCNDGFSATVRIGAVCLAPTNPRDEYQHWIKDMRHSNSIKDEEGSPAFALVNRVTVEAIKHLQGEGHPVKLVPYPTSSTPLLFAGRGLVVVVKDGPDPDPRRVVRRRQNIPRGRPMAADATRGADGVSATPTPFLPDIEATSITELPRAHDDTERRRRRTQHKSDSLCCACRSGKPATDLDEAGLATDSTNDDDASDAAITGGVSRRFPRRWLPGAVFWGPTSTAVGHAAVRCTACGHPEESCAELLFLTLEGTGCFPSHVSLSLLVGPVWLPAIWITAAGSHPVRCSCTRGIFFAAWGPHPVQWGPPPHVVHMQQHALFSSGTFGGLGRVCAPGPSWPGWPD